MTLTEFLLARITEDEASAHEAGGGKWASWNRSWDTEPFRDLAIDNARVAKLPIGIDEHVARHDPARVLAECETKRAMIGRLALISAEPWSSTKLLKDMAVPYADHPDYLPEWRL